MLNFLGIIFVDIAKLSKNIGIQRPTTLKYLRNLEEAALIRRLFTDIDSVSDLQKPDKILLDNSNLLYTISDRLPEVGTVRETFFCNQLASAGHRVEYGGLKSGDFRIDGEMVVEVGGRDKGFSQVKNETRAYVAADDIDSATSLSSTSGKIPLWAFGFLYWYEFTILPDYLKKKDRHAWRSRFTLKCPFYPSEQECDRCLSPVILFRLQRYTYRCTTTRYTAKMDPCEASPIVLWFHPYPKMFFVHFFSIQLFFVSLPLISCRKILLMNLISCKITIKHTLIPWWKEKSTTSFSCGKTSVTASQPRW